MRVVPKMPFLALLFVSCQGELPLEPEAGTPTPTPTATAAPTTAPAPTPTPGSGGGEPPVTNANAPRRIELRVYHVRKPDGEIAPCNAGDPAPEGGPVRYGFTAIPVGYRVTLDATAFDAGGKPTNGECREGDRDCVRWHFRDGAGLIDDYGLGHVFQPKFRVAGEGDFQIQAEMTSGNETVRSAWLWLRFVADVSQSPCSK